MANKHETLGELFTDIADSIRAKNGSTERIIADDFPEEIAAIETGVDTSDATITAMDIPAGEIAYGKDGKIVGEGTFSYEGVKPILKDGYYSAYAMTYGDGKFVSLPSSGIYALYSRDGVDWVYTNLPKSATWYDICYDDGKFIAPGSWSASCMYSEDGVNWTEVQLPFTTGKAYISYGGGKFVIVDDKGNGAHSEDGVNWTQVTLPVSMSFAGIAYGNGIFVATRNGYTDAIYSEDGVNWTQVTLPVSSTWYKIVYGDGKFVIVSDSKLIYSEDGVNWTQVNFSGSSGSRYAFIYGDGKFVNAIYNSTYCEYSTDAINWTQVTLPVSGSWRGAAYGGGKFTMIGADSPNNISHALSTFDMVNWDHTQLRGAENASGGIIFGNGRFYSGYGGYSTTVRYSTDGIKWTRSTNNLDNEIAWGDPCFGNGKFVMVGSVYNYDTETYTHRAAYSTDCCNWTIVTPPAPTYNTWGYVYYVSGMFFGFMGGTDTAYIYSSNGVTWTKGSISNGSFYPIEGEYNKYLMVDTWNNRVAYSTNGTSWSYASLPATTNGEWTRSAYGNGKFVLLPTTGDTALYSTDGTNWTKTSLPAYAGWDDIVYGNGKFVATTSYTYGGGHIFAYSEDGVNWTQGALPISCYHGAVAYGNGTFVVFGSNQARIAISSDGVNWTCELPPEYNIKKDISNGITLSVDGCEAKTLKNIDGRLALDGYVGSLAFTGNYANATYFTESGCSLAVDPAKGMAFVTIQSGTNSSWENIAFTAASLPSGVTLLTHPASSHGTGGTVQSYFTAALTGITGKINVDVYLNSQSSTSFDSIVAELTVTYA